MIQKPILPPVLLPLACMPPIEYFGWLMHSTSIQIEIQETYPRQTCRNRYTILTANGLLNLSVPVIKPLGNHTPVKDVLVDNRQNWAHVHWKTIESAYSRAPFFLYYRDGFEEIFHTAHLKLIDLDMKILQLCCDILKIAPKFTLTDVFNKVPTDFVDMRGRILQKKRTAHSWSVKQYSPYIQVFSDRYPFEPNLFLPDLIFNLGPDAAKYLQNIVPGDSLL